MTESLLLSAFSVTVAVAAVVMSLWEWRPTCAPRRMRHIMENGEYPASGWMLLSAILLVPFALAVVSDSLHEITGHEAWGAIAEWLLYLAAGMSFPLIFRRVFGVGLIFVPPRFRGR